MLSSTAGDYLSPAVTKISDTLGLTETLAGVTLVALGYIIILFKLEMALLMFSSL